MYKLQLYERTVSILRNKLLGTSSCLKQSYFEKSTQCSSSSSSGSSDLDSKVKKPKISDRKKENEAALTKLNTLLKQLVKEDVVLSESKINLAKPSNKRIKKETQEESHTKESVEKIIVKAVKNVAETIGGDVKQTESELLLKLLSPVEPSTTTTNLSDVVKGMKIDRESKPVHKSRAEEVRNLLQKVKHKSAPRERIETVKKTKQFVEKPKPEMVVQKINLFGSKPLGIFTNKDLKESPENQTWQSLYERDLKLAVTHPPTNYFQQMILWTEQGKLWKFPIDNEQGLDEEKKVYFAKHVFLEEHLEPWCPPKGPLRHFMELVCVGLSKNPYYTVEAKKEHIDWYKNYFEDKKKLLQEVGALPVQEQPQKTLE